MAGTYKTESYNDRDLTGNGADDIDYFGTVLGSRTAGESRRKMLDPETDTVIDYRTGVYTTISENNGAGILESQVTEGESYNKVYDGTGYVDYTTGTYKTESYNDRDLTGNGVNDMDGLGTVAGSRTVGESRKKLLDPETDTVIDYRTGVYTTISENNGVVILESQVTEGESYNKV